MAYRLYDVTSLDPAGFREIGTFPTLDDAKVEIVDQIIKAFGSLPHEMVSERDALADGLDVLAWVPGTASCLQFAVNSTL